jgi:hypothetical protein
MGKSELAVAVVSSVLMYFAINEKRLVDLKIFAVWCSLTALTCSHIYSFYREATSTAPYDFERVVVLNVTAVGILVLLGVAVFLRKYLRYSLEFKKPGQ